MKIISGKCVQLTAGFLELPEDVFNGYKELGIKDIFDWQAECLGKKHVLESGHNLVYSAPTSAGKTLVAELIILKRIQEWKRKALFILPYVSVSREKMVYMQRLFGGLGIRVGGFMGGQSPAGGLASVDLALCTIEKGNSLVNRLMEEEELHQLGIVVVDELHMIGDSHRGYLLELLLTKLLYYSKKAERSHEKGIQIVGMSATLPNLDHLADWLRACLYVTDFRPIPLVEMIKVGNDVMDSTLAPLRVYHPPVALPGTDEDDVCGLCLETLLDGHSVLVFCPTKVWCEQLADTLAREIFRLVNRCSELPQSQLLQSRLINADLVDIMEQLKRSPAGLDQHLARMLPFGIAFHHAGLTIEEREIVETGFRRSVLRVLVATSTLSSGVNLPARRVIIRSPLFAGHLIDSLTYRQMIGRAGRKGVDTKGESILLCKPKDLPRVKPLILGSLPPVKSCLVRGNSLSTSIKRAILEVIVNRVVESIDDIKCYIGSTLLAATPPANQTELLSGEDNLASVCDAAVDECVNYLSECELIEVRSDDAIVRATHLGQAVLSSSLGPEDGLAVFAELSKASRSVALDTDLHLVYLVTPVYLDVGSSLDWYVFLSVLEQLCPADRRVADLVGIEERFITRCLRSGGGVGAKRGSREAGKLALHRRFFTALLLAQLVGEASLSSVAQKFQVNRGTLQSLQQQAATYSGMLTTFCNRLGWSHMECLLSSFQSRLIFGVQTELVDLVRLSLVNALRARALHRAGFTSISAVVSARYQDIEKVLKKAVPFESKKQSEVQTNGTNSTRSSKCILGADGSPLTEEDAAHLIIQEAQALMTTDLALLGIKWTPSMATTSVPPDCNGHSTGAPSIDQPSPGNPIQPLDNNNSVNISRNILQKSAQIQTIVTNSDTVPLETNSHKDARTKSQNNSGSEHPIEPIANIENEAILVEANDNETSNHDISDEVEIPDSENFATVTPPVAYRNYVQSVSKAPVHISISTGTISNQIDPVCPTNLPKAFSSNSSVVIASKSGKNVLNSSQICLKNQPKNEVVKGRGKASNSRPHISLCSFVPLDMQQVNDRVHIDASSEIVVADSQIPFTNIMSPTAHKSSQQKVVNLRQRGKKRSVSAIKSPPVLDLEACGIFSQSSRNSSVGNYAKRRRRSSNKKIGTPISSVANFPTASVSPLDSFLVTSQVEELMNGDHRLSRGNSCAAINTSDLFKESLVLDDNALLAIDSSKGEQNISRMEDLGDDDVSNILKSSFVSTSPSVKSTCDPLNCATDRFSIGSTCDWESMLTQGHRNQPIETRCLTSTPTLLAGLGSKCRRKGRASSTHERGETEDMNGQTLGDTFTFSMLEEVDQFPETSQKGRRSSHDSRKRNSSSRKSGSHVSEDFFGMGESIQHAGRSSTDMFGDAIATSTSDLFVSSSALPGVSDSAIEQVLKLKCDTISVQKVSPANSPSNEHICHNSSPLESQQDMFQIQSGALSQQKTGVVGMEAGSQSSLSSTLFSVIDVCADLDLWQAFQTDFCATCYRSTNDETNVISMAFAWRPIENITRSKCTEPLLQTYDCSTNSYVEIVGLAVSCGNKNDVFYIDLNTNVDTKCTMSANTHSLCHPSLRRLSTRWSVVKSLLQLRNISISPPLVIHDAKRFCRLFKGSSGLPIPIFSPLTIAKASGKQGWRLRDPCITSWMLDPDSGCPKIFELVKKYTPDITPVLQDFSLDNLHASSRIIPSHGVDPRLEASALCYITGALSVHLQPLLNSHRLASAYDQVEMPTQALLADVEITGMAFDPIVLTKERDLLAACITDLEEAAYALAGRRFNIGTPKDVSTVLFLELRLPPKGVPSGDTLRPITRPRGHPSRLVQHSTSKEVLLRLSPLHPLPRIILNWRRLTHIVSHTVTSLISWTDNLDCTSSLSRFRSIYDPYTATGRISLCRPNIQSVPNEIVVDWDQILFSESPFIQQKIKHLSLNKIKSIFFRRAFTVDSNRCLLSADFCQLELRLLAHFSQDPALIKLLNQRGDAFKVIAAMWLGREDVESVTAKERQNAKHLCYALLYGMGPRVLAEEIGVTCQEAEQMIASFLDIYAGVNRYIQSTIQECRQKGQVTTFSGRIRLISGINNFSNPYIRSHSERQSVNTTVQGSAADISKRAMLLVDSCIRKDKDLSCAASLVLHLHDELIYEVEKCYLTKMASVLKSSMETAVDLSVPLPVKVKYGPNWAEMEEIQM